MQAWGGAHLDPSSQVAVSQPLLWDAVIVIGLTRGGESLAKVTLQQPLGSRPSHKSVGGRSRSGAEALPASKDTAEAGAVSPWAHGHTGTQVDAWKLKHS